MTRRRFWVAGALVPALLMMAAIPAGAKDVSGSATAPSGSSFATADQDGRNSAIQVCDHASKAKRAHILVSSDGVSAVFTFECRPLRGAKLASAHYNPTAADFQLGVNVLSQECFGDAGCDLTYRITVNYVGPQTPDPSKSYTVTYSVNGGNTPQSNSFTLHGTQASYPSQEIIQTPPGPALTATATSVLEG